MSVTRDGQALPRARRHQETATAGTTPAVDTTLPQAQQGLSRTAQYLLGGLRIFLGWIFLWAFIDKLWGLGYSTPSDKSWLNGGSPTSGFLGNAVKGPLSGFYGDLAGQTWVDWLFMLGCLGIGLALILGIGTRIAAVTGSILLVGMWSAALLPENNPVLDEHLVYVLLLVLIAVTSAGRFLGFGRAWERIVKHTSFLV